MKKEPNKPSVSQGKFFLSDNGGFFNNPVKSYLKWGKKCLTSPNHFGGRGAVVFCPNPCNTVQNTTSKAVAVEVDATIECVHPLTTVHVMGAADNDTGSTGLATHACAVRVGQHLKGQGATQRVVDPNTPHSH